MSHDRVAAAQDGYCIAESRRQTERPIEYLIVQQVGVVEDPGAAANDRLAFSPRIPGKAGLWSKVFRGSIYEAVEGGTEFRKFRCPAQIIIRNVAIEVVAKTKIQGEARC